MKSPIDIVREGIADSNSMRDYAKKIGMSQQYLSELLQGKRGVGPKLLRALGLKEIVRYEKANGK